MQCLLGDTAAFNSRRTLFQLQGQSPSLAESAQKSLTKVGVSVRGALVEKVAEGRSVAGSPDLGKKLTLNINGKKQTEESDLVLWTAGA